MNRKMEVEYRIGNLVASQKIDLANITISELNDMYLDSINSGICFEVVNYETI